MGTLFIVATPIGNLEDITLRAIKTLERVTYIACEDTRRTGMLLVHLHIQQKTLLRYDDRSELSETPHIIELLQQNDVALVSDAGTPLLNDPGFVLVREARKRGITVISIPGASAILAALTSSGLPTDKFMFLGYPPEKQSHRKKLFAELPKNTTLVFYCAPHKLLSTLEDLKDVAETITIARELTKIHEEVWQGTIAAALTHFANPKGEFVLLLRLA